MENPQVEKITAPAEETEVDKGSKDIIGKSKFSKRKVTYKIGELPRNQIYFTYYENTGEDHCQETNRENPNSSSADSILVGWESIYSRRENVIEGCNGEEVRGVVGGWAWGHMPP